MRINANNVNWVPCYCKDVYGYFTDVRIDPTTIPEEYNFYELSDDCDGIPCRYRPRILVNFYGTFITKGILPVEDGCDAGYIVEDDGYKEDWTYGGLKLNELIEIDEEVYLDE